VNLFDWLSYRRDQANELTRQAGWLGEQTASLVDMVQSLATAHRRLTDAVDATLRAHQPDPAGQCVQDRQQWPCHTVQLSMHALRVRTGEPDDHGPPRPPGLSWLAEQSHAVPDTAPVSEEYPQADARGLLDHPLSKENGDQNRSRST
jgi:hypothetical protein